MRAMLREFGLPLLVPRPQRPSELDPEPATGTYFRPTWMLAKKVGGVSPFRKSLQEESKGSRDEDFIPRTSYVNHISREGREEKEENDNKKTSQKTKHRQSNNGNKTNELLS